MESIRYSLNKNQRMFLEWMLPYLKSPEEYNPLVCFYMDEIQGHKHITAKRAVTIVLEENKYDNRNKRLLNELVAVYAHKYIRIKSMFQS